MHVQVGDKASSNHHKKHPAKLQSFSHKVKKHASDTFPDGSAVDSSKIPAVAMATINAHTSTDSKQNISDSKQSTVTASRGSMRIQNREKKLAKQPMGHSKAVRNNIASPEYKAPSVDTTGITCICYVDLSYGTNKHMYIQKYAEHVPWYA